MVLIPSILVLVLRVLIQASISECIKATLYSLSCVSASFLEDAEYFWPRSLISIPYHVSISIDQCTYYAWPKFGIFIST